MRPRELALLLPILAVLLAATFAFPDHADDEAAYVTLARMLVEGRYATGDDDAILDSDPSSPDLWFGPGLPLALAPFVAIDAPVTLLRLVGPLSLFSAVLLFYLLARGRWGERTGRIAAYALGLYPPFWAVLPNVHSEPLALLFLVAGMFGIFLYLRDGGFGRLALASGSLAGLAVTRVAYGWVLTLALAFLLVRWLLRRSVASIRLVQVFSVALLLCAPWLAYTLAETGRFPHWGNSGSLSLYWMASPHPGDLGDWHQGNEVFSEARLAPHRPFFEGLRGLDLADQTRTIEREALRNIADHPATYAEHVVANLSRLFFNSPYTATEQATNDVFYAVPNALLLAGIVLSLVILVPRRRIVPAEAVPFAVLGIAAFGLHALLSAYPRMLMPIVPVIVWFAVLALVEVRVLTVDRSTGRSRTRRRTGTARGGGRPVEPTQAVGPLS